MASSINRTFLFFKNNLCLVVLGLHFCMGFPLNCVTVALGLLVAVISLSQRTGSRAWAAALAAGDSAAGTCGL